MKTFTDIEQSKRLAEILPFETADMGYLWNGYSFSKYPVSIQTIFIRTENIPCWSLAALLGVLPRIDIEKEICSDDTYEYRVKAYIGDGYIGDWYDNSVDACYEMILKLYEFKML